MSFFSSRKRQKTAVKKKKWEVESESEEEDPVQIDANDTEEVQEMTCKSCNGERDADAFCLGCKLYYCIECFSSSHAKSDAENNTTEQPTGSETKVGEAKQNVKAQEGKSKSSGKKYEHKLRPLVGSRSLETLEVGWIVGDEKSQAQKVEEREQERNRKEAEEKARKEEEMRQKKLKEEQLAEERKKIAAAAAAAIAARVAAAATPAAAQASPMGTPQGTLPIPTPPQGPPRHVFLSNIPFNAKVSDVRNMFKGCGRIVELTMPKAPNHRKRPYEGAPAVPQNSHRGIAFIEFDSPAGAEAAIKMNGQLLMYRPVRVVADAMGAHRNQLVRPTGVPYKTKMCTYFMQNKCYRGDKCSFAHHPREIQKGAFIRLKPGNEAPVDGGFKW